MFIPDSAAAEIRTVTAYVRRHLDCLDTLSEQLSSRARALVGADLWGWLQSPRVWPLHPLSLYLLSIVEARVIRNAPLVLDYAMVAEAEELWAQAIEAAAKRSAEPAESEQVISIQ